MSTFALKMAGLIFMVIDHIGYYIPGAPLWLRCIGRSSFPLFLFCMAWGYHYTKSRGKYLLRLYAMSLFMTAFGYAVGACFPTAGIDYGNHNIFVPLLLTAICISAVELFSQNKKKGWVLLGALFLSQMLYYALPEFFPALNNLSGDVLTGVIPNLYLNEYGFEFVALGVLMYFLRERKDLFCGAYILFCIAQFSGEMLESGFAVQWMMILALPLMLRYNRKKGPGLKYFFYIFYPVHTFLLFYITNFVLAQS